MTATATPDVVLIDVDNTLVDNDRIVAELRGHLECNFGLVSAERHDRVGATLPVDGGRAEAVLEEFRREGVDDDALALQSQREGIEAFSTSWEALLSRLKERSAQLAGASAA